MQPALDGLLCADDGERAEGDRLEGIPHGLAPVVVDHSGGDDALLSCLVWLLVEALGEGPQIEPRE